nr:MAG TPA: hypothetical protein [Caudoviricetes sp.]
MTLTGTFTFDDLINLSGGQALEKLLSIRTQGLQDEFEAVADVVGDWDELYSMINGMSIPELLNLEEEGE